MVTKEELKYLNIKNLYFKKFSGITILLQPFIIEEDKITVFCSSELPESGILRIETKLNEYNLFSTTVKDYKEDNSWTIFLEDPFPEEIETKLREIQEINKNLDKRKEERITIGLQNWEQFGMARPDCKFYFGKTEVKNIISNASVHGALLTGSRSFARIGENILFQVSFTDGTITQNAIIISSKQINNEYYNYSIRFVEPISLIWNKHISDIIKTTTV